MLCDVISIKIWSFRTAYILDTPGISNPQLIENLQEKAQAALEEYLRQQHPSQSSRFGKLLLRLPALRLIRPAVIEGLFFSRMIGNYSIENLLSGMLMSGNTFNTNYCGNGSPGMMNNMNGANCGINLNNNIGTVPGSIPTQMNNFATMQMNGSSGLSSVNQLNGLGSTGSSFTGNLNGLNSTGMANNLNGMPNIMNTVPLQFSPNLTSMSGMTYNFNSTTNGLNGLGLVGNPTLNSSGSGLSRSPSSTGSDGENGHGSPPGHGVNGPKLQNGTPPR